MYRSSGEDLYTFAQREKLQSSFWEIQRQIKEKYNLPEESMKLIGEKLDCVIEKAKTESRINCGEITIEGYRSLLLEKVITQEIGRDMYTMIMNAIVKALNP